MLDSAIHIDVGALLFKVTRCGQDQIGVVDTLVACMSHVDDIGAFRDILVSKLIGSKDEDNFGVFLHTLLGSNSKIESTDSAGLGVEDVKAVPTLSFIDYIGVLG